jgi:hypothetical protein
VHQRGGLKYRIAATVAQARSRQPPQFLVSGGKQGIARSGLTRMHPLQQLRDLGHLP